MDGKSQRVVEVPVSKAFEEVSDRRKGRKGRIESGNSKFASIKREGKPNDNPPCPATESKPSKFSTSSYGTHQVLHRHTPKNHPSLPLKKKTPPPHQKQTQKSSIVIWEFVCAYKGKVSNAWLSSGLVTMSHLSQLVVRIKSAFKGRRRRDVLRESLPEPALLPR